MDLQRSSIPLLGIAGESEGMDMGKGEPLKPILLSGEMVRAILDGRKTQTRRPLKPQPDYLHDAAPYQKIWMSPLKCPFGKVGDRLWVRETFCLEYQVESDQKPPFTDGRPIRWEFAGMESDPEGADSIWLQTHYRATDPTPELAYEDSDGEPTVRWKPSIHMPRWASRITLEITDIRIERLQEITEEDAKAEGVLPCPHPLSKTDECLDCYLDAGEYACSFLNLWNGLYAKQGLGVDVNPWVWVITFRRKKDDCQGNS